MLSRTKGEINVICTRFYLGENIQEITRKRRYEFIIFRQIFSFRRRTPERSPLSATPPPGRPKQPLRSLARLFESTTRENIAYTLPRPSPTPPSIRVSLKRHNLVYLPEVKILFVLRLQSFVIRIFLDAPLPSRPPSGSLIFLAVSLGAAERKNGEQKFEQMNFFRHPPFSLVTPFY